MKNLIATLGAIGLPTFVSAAVINNADDIINEAFRYGNIAIALLIAFAVVYIVYAIVIYVIKGDDEEKLKAAKSKILWGVIGLAAILSIWGLVRIVKSTFYTGTNTAPTGEFPVIQRRF